MYWLISNPMVPAAACALALLILYLGKRGRRVDDHPVCRRCGFDLYGLPATSVVCSECGADLRRSPRAWRRQPVRVGNRGPCKRVMRAAQVLLVPALLWLGVSGWFRSHEANWDSHKPVWWLRSQANSRDAAASAAAVRELVRRLAAGRLSDGQIATLADDALDIQANPKRPWTTAWGTLLEKSYDAGKVSNDRWLRYARQSVDFRLDVRPKISRGEPLLARLTTLWPRVGPAQRFTLVSLDAHFRVGTADLPLVGSVRVEPHELAALKEGEQVASLSIQADLYDYASRKPSPNGLAPLITVPVQVSGKWTLLPADVSSVGLLHDPALAPAMARSVSVVAASVVKEGLLPDGTYLVTESGRGQSAMPPGSVLVLRSPGGSPVADDVAGGFRPRTLIVDLAFAAPPAHMNFSVRLRYRGVAYATAPRRTFAIEKGSRSPLQLTFSLPAPIAAELLKAGETVEVILQPDARTAPRTPDVVDIWGNDVVITGVSATPATLLPQPGWILGPGATTAPTVPRASNPADRL